MQYDIYLGKYTDRTLRPKPGIVIRFREIIPDVAVYRVSETF